jgi:Ca2+-binding RTX toxin-like protein
LTSEKFDYSGSEMTIYGGNGNDIIWANDSVDNIIYGGLGDDTLVGGSQANTFIFEENWGNDVVYANGIVTLNFIGVAEGALIISDNTITYGDNTITLINFENSDYSITYSQLA